MTDLALLMLIHCVGGIASFVYLYRPGGIWADHPEPPGAAWLLLWPLMALFALLSEKR